MCAVKNLKKEHANIAAHKTYKTKYHCKGKQQACKNFHVTKF